jgi:hypothetical protein
MKESKASGEIYIKDKKDNIYNLTTSQCIDKYNFNKKDPIVTSLDMRKEVADFLKIKEEDVNIFVDFDGTPINMIIRHTPVNA